MLMSVPGNGKLELSPDKKVYGILTNSQHLEWLMFTFGSSMAIAISAMMVFEFGDFYTDDGSAVIKDSMGGFALSIGSRWSSAERLAALWLCKKVVQAMRWIMSCASV